MGTVAADPGVGADALAHEDAQQLPGGDAVELAPEVPERLVEPGQGRHEDRATAVEAAAIGYLPDVLDPARIVAEEAVPQRLEGAGHRLGMAFEAGLAPTGLAVVGLDADQEPAGRDVERFVAGDLHGGPSDSRVSRKKNGAAMPLRSMRPITWLSSTRRR